MTHSLTPVFIGIPLVVLAVVAGFYGFRISFTAPLLLEDDDEMFEGTPEITVS